MLTDGDESRSRGGGLGEMGEGREVGPQSTTGLLAKQLRRRWKIIGAIVVTAITTAAIHRVDGAVTKDVTVFAILTAALLVYFLVTIRADLKLE